MKYILTFILSFLSFLVCSQNITITDIPTIDQLPVNAIHRVFRDSEGYMWYGTVNGLCRDDGYHVKVFRSDIETPGLLERTIWWSVSLRIRRGIYGSVQTKGYTFLINRTTVYILWTESV